MSSLCLVHINATHTEYMNMWFVKHDGQLKSLTVANKESITRPINLFLF